MARGREIVEIDGRRFAVRRLPDPRGERLAVERPPADDLVLPPWTLDDHLVALDRRAFLEGQVPRVDLPGLARDVLATSGVALGRDDAAELAPLALGWAYGAPAGASPARPGLRPWTSRERALALDACTDRETGAVRPGALLRAMVLAADPSADPRALSGAEGLGLLDAVTRLNAPGDDLSEGPGSTELARITLELCRGLGWTPSQVWSAPAPEIDRLLALLARAAPTPARAPPPAPPRAPSPAHAHSRLASFPDAVIIDLR